LVILTWEAAPCLFQQKYMNWREFRPYGKGFGVIVTEDHYPKLWLTNGCSWARLLRYDS
jgi:hypothetical protein